MLVICGLLLVSTFKFNRDIEDLLSQEQKVIAVQSQEYSVQCDQHVIMTLLTYMYLHTLFILLIATNRVEHLCITVILYIV